MVYAAGILAEIGDIDRFDDQAAVAKYAGLTLRKGPVLGPFEAEDTKRICSGNRFLRYYLVEGANLVKNRDPVYSASTTGRSTTKSPNTNTNTPSY